MRGTIIGIMGIGGRLTSDGIRELVETMAKEFGWNGKTFHWSEGTAALAWLNSNDGVGPVVMIGNSKGVDNGDRLAEQYGKPIAAFFSVASAFPETLPANVERVYQITASMDWRQFTIEGGQWIDRQVIKATHVGADDSEQLAAIVKNELLRLTSTQPDTAIAKPETRWTHNRFDRKTFLDKVREAPFDGMLTQKQVDGLELCLTIWEERFAARDMRELAYDLATAWLETGQTMEHMEERGSDRYFDRYDPVHNPRKASELGNTQPGDGLRFKGRGWPQMTGRGNYGRASIGLRPYGIDVDLVAEPDRALDPEISILLLLVGNHEGWWTGKRLPNFAGYGNWDLKGARSVVNGTDRWQEIGTAAGEFLEALKASARPIETSPPLPPSLPDADYPVEDDLLVILADRWPQTTEQGRINAAMLADALALRLAPSKAAFAAQPLRKEETMFPNMLAPLDGVKTYIVVIIVMAIAICEGLLGIDIPGAEMQSNWTEYVMAALGLGGLRSALGKVGN